MLKSAANVGLSMWEGRADWRTNHANAKLTCHLRASFHLELGYIFGQKLSLKPSHKMAIRVRLELADRDPYFVLFNLAIDSKLCGCDLVRMKVVDVMASGQIKERASVMQSKTQKPVRFEISERKRVSVAKWMDDPLIFGSEYL